MQARLLIEPQIAREALRLVGPISGAALFAFAGGSAVAMVDAASFVVAAIAIVFWNAVAALAPIVAFVALVIVHDRVIRDRDVVRGIARHIGNHRRQRLVLVLEKSIAPGRDSAGVDDLHARAAIGCIDAQLLPDAELRAGWRSALRSRRIHFHDPVGHRDDGLVAFGRDADPDRAWPPSPTSARCRAWCRASSAAPR